MKIIKNLSEFIKIILVVLGIISYNPKVNIDNIYVYRDFANPENIRAQIKFSNLLNSSITEIIKSGVEVEFICFVKTRCNKEIVFSDKSIKRINYQKDFFVANKIKFDDEKKLEQWLSIFDFVVLSNANNLISRPLETEIDVFCRSELNVDLMKLWGNRPKILITYSIEKKNED
ncbi:MAG: hypothetical protein ACP5QT_02785 [Brevinematia bacterium]